MKKVLCMLIAMMLISALVGCAEIVKTETKAVEATIIEVDHDPVRILGKVTLPADYDILIKYEDVETWIDIPRNEYDKYKDLVGTTIEANFIVEYYDDDTVKQYLALIEE